MSIRLKIALASLVVFIVGTGGLLFAVRSAYLKNVGVVAHEVVADSGSLYRGAAGNGGADSAAVIQVLKSWTGSDYAVLTDDGTAYSLAAATNDELSSYDLSTIPRDLEDGVNRLELRTAGDSRVLIAAIPVTGEQAGVLLVERDIARLMKDMQGAPIMVVGVLVLIYIITVAVTIGLLNVLVFARLHDMSERISTGMNRIAGGDYEALDHAAEVTTDEVGRFEERLYGFMRVVGSTLKELSQTRS